MATEPATETRPRPRPSSSSTRPRRCSRCRRPKPPGLVPLKAEETSELDKRVAQFVDELAKLDSNSPEFGKKVDQLTAMGRKEIAEAAGASNRFLDRPVKAIDKDSGIGADLTELRRTVEALDPKEATKTTQAARDHPVRQPRRPLFRQVSQLADAHLEDPRQPRQRQGRAADGQCGDRHRARELVEDDAQARADDPHLEDARPAARGQGQRARRDRSRQGQGDPRDRAVLHPPAHDRPADADGGDGAGLSRARPRQEEQCRAGEGRRPRLDHDGRRRCAPRSPSPRR